MIIQKVIKILNEIAILLDLSNSNRFKGKAIRKAIRTLENTDINFQDLKMKDLQTLPGIGKGIAKIIMEIVLMGTSSYKEKLEHTIPISLAPLLKISGIKRYEILKFYQKFLIKSLEDLKQSTPEKFLAMGISEKRQKRIQKSITEYLRYGPRLLWWNANGIAKMIKEKILKCTYIIQCEISGEIRRCLNTICQIDLVIDSRSSKQALEWISESPWVQKIIKRTSNSLIFQGSSGIKIKITVAKENFGKSLFLTTGSSTHIRALNRWIKSKGISESVSKMHITRGEEEIYEKANLQYIPSELRENGKEIQAAYERNLPKLLEKSDIRGIYHCHTVDSDGIHTFEQLARAAEELYKWDYIGISDHSKSCQIAGGMNEDQLFKQMHAINEFNLKGSCSCKVLAGIECDILLNGELDFSDEILKQLDFVIVSIHSYFDLSKSAMTHRLIKAIENSYTTMIGHISGRLLLYRFGYQLDMNKVIDACIANNKIIEINSQPSRLDMDWSYWKRAITRGLRCVINPDAHSIQELKFYEAGVNVARKGWLTSEAVINTSAFPIK